MNQESFINISVPKIDKDYSLYRTYVIFRTLGLRHLVVVDVHNRVVGLITRKDLMPFKMQERLETLLEQDGDEPTPSAVLQRRTSDVATAGAATAAAGSTAGDKLLSNSHADSQSNRRRHRPLPVVNKYSSAKTRTNMLAGLKEEDEENDETHL